MSQNSYTNLFDAGQRQPSSTMSQQNILQMQQVGAPSMNPYMERTKLINSLNKSFKSETKVGSYDAN